jgi:hypothetical protein
MQVDKCSSTETSKNLNPLLLGRNCNHFSNYCYQSSSSSSFAVRPANVGVVQNTGLRLVIINYYAIVSKIAIQKYLDSTLVLVLYPLTVF